MDLFPSTLNILLTLRTNLMERFLGVSTLFSRMRKTIKNVYFAKLLVQEENMDDCVKLITEK